MKYDCVFLPLMCVLNPVHVSAIFKTHLTTLKVH